MTVRFTTAALEAQAPRLKVLIHGPSGAGKTFLAGTTGDDAGTLIISAEGGLLTLRGREIRCAAVESVDDFRDVVGQLARGTFADWCRWVVVDSITEIAEQSLVAARRGTKDGRLAYGTMADEVTELVRKLCALPMHVVVLAKQRRNDTDGLTQFGPSMPGQKSAEGLPYFFDEVFALRSEGQGERIVRYLQTANDGRFEAKDRSGVLPERISPPSLKTVAELIYPTQEK